LLRDLALAAARHQGDRPSADAIQEAERRFRQAHQLCETEAQGRWLEENHLTGGRFEELIREEALLDTMRAQRKVSWPLLDQLRITGEYRALRERARDKQRQLEAAGLGDARLEEIGLSREELLQWHFGRLASRVEPDLQAYACRLGYSQAEDFVRAVLREYCYVRLTNQGPHPQASDGRAADNGGPCLTTSTGPDLQGASSRQRQGLSVQTGQR
jgi:hypothetical protein